MAIPFSFPSPCIVALALLSSLEVLSCLRNQEGDDDGDISTPVATSSTNMSFEQFLEQLHTNHSSSPTLGVKALEQRSEQLLTRHPSATTLVDSISKRVQDASVGRHVAKGFTNTHDHHRTLEKLALMPRNQEILVDIVMPRRRNATGKPEFRNSSLLEELTAAREHALSAQESAAVRTKRTSSGTVLLKSTEGEAYAVASQGDPRVSEWNVKRDADGLDVNSVGNMNRTPTLVNRSYIAELAVLSQKEELTRKIKGQMKGVGPEYVSWGIAACSICLVLFSFVFYLYKFGNMPIIARLRWTNAWLNCLQAVVIIAPLLIPQVTEMMPPYLHAHYALLPFWGAFLNCRYRGTFIMNCYDMTRGMSVAVSTMSFWNMIIPGGVACAYDPKCPLPTNQFFDTKTGVIVSTVLAGLLAYLVLVSNTRTGFKRVFLCFLAEFWLEHQNPRGDWQRFAPFIFDWRTGELGSGFWEVTVVSYAMLMRYPLQFGLPIQEMTFGLVSFECETRLSEGIAELVEDSTHMFFLFTHWRKSAYATNTDGVHSTMERMEKVQDELQRVLERAWYEEPVSKKYFSDGDPKLRHYKWALDVLKHIHHRCKYLDQITGWGFSCSSDEEALLLQETLAPYFIRLTDIFSRTLSVMVAYSDPLDKKRTLAQIRDGLQLANSLYATLKQELRNLCIEKKVSIQRTRETCAFVHASSMWIRIIEEYLLNVGNYHTEPPSLTNNLHSFVTVTVVDKRQHFKAAMYTIVWLCLFLFSQTKLASHGTPLITMSLMYMDEYSKIADILSLSFFRAAGVGLGVAVSNVPAHLFCLGMNKFKYVPSDVISYCVVFVAQWSLLMYGSISGPMFYYMFQCWAAFGSNQQVRPLQHIQRYNAMRDDDVRLWKDYVAVELECFDEMKLATYGIVFAWIAMILSLVFHVAIGQLRPEGNILENLRLVLTSASEYIQALSSQSDEVVARQHLEEAMLGLEDSVEVEQQFKMLTSDTPLRGALPVVLDQCQLIIDISRCLRTDKDVNIKGLPDVAWMTTAFHENNYLYFDVGISEQLAKHSELWIGFPEFCYTIKTQEIQDLISSAKSSKDLSHKQLGEMAVDSEERRAQWTKQLEKVSDEKQLEMLIENWSLERAVNLICLCVLKILVYVDIRENRQRYDKLYGPRNQSGSSTATLFREVREKLTLFKEAREKFPRLFRR